MSLAAALGLFPMISEPGGDVRTKWPGTAQRLVCFRGESVKTVPWAERSVFWQGLVPHRNCSLCYTEKVWISSECWTRHSLGGGRDKSCDFLLLFWHAVVAARKHTSHQELSSSDRNRPMFPRATWFIVTRVRGGFWLTKLATGMWEWFTSTFLFHVHLISVFSDQMKPIRCVMWLCGSYPHWHIK